MRRWQGNATGSRIRGVALALSGTLLLAGCAGGSFTGATQQARPVHHLYMILFVVATVIFVLVEGLILWAVVRYRRRDDALPPQFHGNNLLEISWTLGPLIIVAVLFALSFQVISKVDAEASNPEVTVNVTGFQWQWEFTYAGEKVQVEKGQPPQDFSIKGTTTKPPQVYLPVGETIHFNEQSKDVIHSLYIPEFLFKRDLVPGHTNSFQITISKPGVYHGQCAQFCGLAHGQMHFYIHAVSRPEYNAWLAEQIKKAESGCPDDTTPGQIAAKNTAFDKDCLAEPANKAFTLTFNNQDTGIPHNVEIYTDKTASKRLGGATGPADLITGPASTTYRVPALPPGRYYFHCDAHPDSMTGTLVVK
jgi:cytochrome c oxidase subunit II